MPNYLPQPQAQQSSTQAEREEVAVQRQDLEASELEAERSTRALNLNAVRDAETKSPAPLIEAAGHVFLRNNHLLYQNMLVPKSHLRFLPLKQGLPSGIKVTSTNSNRQDC